MHIFRCSLTGTLTITYSLTSEDRIVRCLPEDSECPIVNVSWCCICCEWTYNIFFAAGSPYQGDEPPANDEQRPQKLIHSSLRLEIFPQYGCLQFPHVIHLATAGLSLVVFTTVATVMAVAVVERSSIHPCPQSQRNARVELYSLVLKTLLAVVSMLLASYKQIQGFTVRFSIFSVSG